jgi:hypothetical protein
MRKSSKPQRGQFLQPSVALLDRSDGWQNGGSGGNSGELKVQPKLDPLSPTLLAETYSSLGEKTQAFAFLEVAYQQHTFTLIFLGVCPNFNNLRSDSRFANLLRRMGLPQASVPTPS